MVDTAEGKLWFEVVTYGGRKPTGIDALAWALQAEKLGAGEFLVTSMDRDGTKDGYDIELTRAISERVNVPIIASGGAGTPKHLSKSSQREKQMQRWQLQFSTTTSTQFQL